MGNNADRAEDAGKHQMVQTFAFCHGCSIPFRSFVNGQKYTVCGTYVKTYVK